jgi:hypothetical protein
LVIGFPSGFTKHFEWELCTFWGVHTNVSTGTHGLEISILLETALHEIVYLEKEKGGGGFHIRKRTIPPPSMCPQTKKKAILKLPLCIQDKE